MFHLPEIHRIPIFTIYINSLKRLSSVEDGRSYLCIVHFPFYFIACILFFTNYLFFYKGAYVFPWICSESSAVVHRYLLYSIHFLLQQSYRSIFNILFVSHLLLSFFSNSFYEFTNVRIIYYCVLVLYPVFLLPYLLFQCLSQIHSTNCTLRNITL